MPRFRLNAAQRRVVEHDLGPLLVLAGAGSGKTGVVTRRIARLIERGVPASCILAMTFTNKAAGEMKERVAGLLRGGAGRELTVSTFHRFGLGVIASEGKALGLRGGRFVVLDAGDGAAAVRDGLRAIRAGRSFDVHAILQRISMAKSAFLSPEAYAEAVVSSDDEYDEITALVYPHYAERLRDLQAFDFDDLIGVPVQLWRRRKAVRQRWARKFRYLIVDEYQDTNAAQLELLRGLTLEHDNLCVVGDDDQSIYAWRGADVRNILDFETHFPGAKVVRLERNYRSSPEVLQVANAVLSASEARRHVKKLVAVQPAGATVEVVTAPDAMAEAAFVSDQIKGQIGQGACRPADVAVLYRSNLQAAELETSLRERGVPFRLVGGTQYFERKEVKDVIAYLMLAVEPSSELALRRVLNYPARGVGSVALERLAQWATARGTSLWKAVEQAGSIEGLSEGARQGCRQLQTLMGRLRQAIDGATPSAAAAAQLLDAIELKQVLFAESSPNHKAAARRWGNVRTLLRTLERHDAKRRSDRRGLGEFLRLLTLREDDRGDDEQPGQQVTLSTIHGAKGLEWPWVFVVGLEEGLLPHARVMTERATEARPLDGVVTDDIEQERRLFYVAVTRARERLVLCHAEARAARGKMVRRVPSRFLLGIGEELLQRREVDAPGVGAVDAAREGAAGLLAALASAGSGQSG